MHNGPKSIRPDELYDLATVAHVLGVSPRTFKQQWIHSGKMLVVKNGHSYTLLGSEVIRAHAEEQQLCAHAKSLSSTPLDETGSSSAGPTKPAAAIKGKPTQRTGRKRSAKP